MVAYLRTPIPPAAYVEHWPGRFVYASGVPVSPLLTAVGGGGERGQWAVLRLQEAGLRLLADGGGW
jgi:hypothetical protein